MEGWGGGGQVDSTRFCKGALQRCFVGVHGTILPHMVYDHSLSLWTVPQIQLLNLKLLYHPCPQMVYEQTFVDGAANPSVESGWRPVIGSNTHAQRPVGSVVGLLDTVVGLLDTVVGLLDTVVGLLDTVLTFGLQGRKERGTWMTSVSGRSCSLRFCCTRSMTSSTVRGGSPLMASDSAWCSSTMCTSVTIFLW